MDAAIVPARADDVAWTPVANLPPTPEELGRRHRANAVRSFAFYGFAVVVAVAFLVGFRLLRDVDALAALAAVIALLGYVQYREYSERNRREERTDRALAYTRVGATPASLHLDGPAHIEIPWAQVEAPVLLEGAAPWRFALRYEGPDGEMREERLGPAQLAAILGLPYRPPWEVAPEVVRALDREFRERGMTPPAVGSGPLSPG